MMERQRKFKTLGYTVPRKLMAFGDFELPQYNRQEEQFHCETRLMLDQVQQCLIDNIWHIPSMPGSTGQKLTVIKALINHFLTQKVIQKPEDKKYQCYGVLTGSQAGVYATWEETTIAINSSDKKPSYKGYTTIAEALTAVRATAGPNYFISTLLKGKSPAIQQVFTTQDKTYLDVISNSDDEEKKNTSKPGTTYNLPTDINTYIRTLADKSAWMEVNQIQEALRWFHDNPQTGITICYEAEFNYKLQCQEKFITCKESTALSGCNCQLIYCLRKTCMDINTYKPHKYRGKLITPFLLMDYGLLFKLWVRDIETTQDFPWKLGQCIRHLLEEEHFRSLIVCTFDSSPPEWINLQIEPARHIIKLEPHKLEGKEATIENYLPSDEDHHYEAIPSSAEQVKHWRASIQGSNWLWDDTTDRLKYTLAAETFTEKIFWSKTYGTEFFPFKITTQHTALHQHYQRKNEAWQRNKARPTAQQYRQSINRRSPTPTGPSRAASMGSLGGSVEERNLDNMMEI